MTAVLQIRNVSKSYGSHQVLRGVSLDVEKGKVTCVIGPSGSGKSTLLRCVNRLEGVDDGQIIVGGELIGLRVRGDRLIPLSERQLARQRTKIGMVFQSFNLFPHMTVLENVIEAPIGVLKRSRNEVHAEAMALLAQVGLDHKADAYPRELSGGQQQRVAIARTLAMHPDVILMDEPTSALDPETVGEVLSIIRQLAARHFTMVIVTHEIGLTREVADTVVFMVDGAILESGTAREVFETPRHQRTRDFIASIL